MMSWKIVLTMMLLASTVAPAEEIVWGDGSDGYRLVQLSSDGIADVVEVAAAPERSQQEGDQTWVSILCRLDPDDIDDDEAPGRDYFESMLHRPETGLSSYWSEVSTGAISLDGSFVVDWLPLPEPYSSYVPVPGTSCTGGGTTVDLGRLFDDCTAAADDLVDFSEVSGIQIYTSQALDGCAWGGKRFSTLDGQTRNWPTTWMGPQHYRHQGMVVHEMGHAMGLPHTNNSDGDSSTYDSPWDVMSSATGGGRFEPPYGRLPVHLSGSQKARLGWMHREFPIDTTGSGEVLLEHAAGGDFLKIPLDHHGRHLTAEVRGGSASAFETELPGSGPVVILHIVDPTRVQPAWVVDGDQPPATYSSTEGVMWRPGEVFETFEDGRDQSRLRLSIDTPVGYGVSVSWDLTLDVCPGADDGLDQDDDSVPDGCDSCPGFDDRLDQDGDGVADGCDLCRGDDASGDADNDGVCGDLDCDDSDPDTSVLDSCGVCGGDNSSCSGIFSDSFESGLGPWDTHR